VLHLNSGLLFTVSRPIIIIKYKDYILKQVFLYCTRIFKPPWRFDEFWKDMVCLNIEYLERRLSCVSDDEKGTGRISEKDAVKKAA
jgi:hypothetical protein